MKLDELVARTERFSKTRLYAGIVIGICLIDMALGTYGIVRYSILEFEYWVGLSVFLMGGTIFLTTATNKNKPAKVI